MHLIVLLVGVFLTPVLVLEPPRLLPEAAHLRVFLAAFGSSLWHSILLGWEGKAAWQD